MKKYIRICDCCGNTFETDKDIQIVCLFCYRKMQHDFEFWYKYVLGEPQERHLAHYKFIMSRHGYKLI
jgi:predicted amidophosphoribosyltransferase